MFRNSVKYLTIIIALQMLSCNKKCDEPFVEVYQLSEEDRTFIQDDGSGFLIFKNSLGDSIIYKGRGITHELVDEAQIDAEGKCIYLGTYYLEHLRVHYIRQDDPEKELVISLEAEWEVDHSILRIVIDPHGGIINLKYPKILDTIQINNEVYNQVYYIEYSNGSEIYYTKTEGIIQFRASFSPYWKLVQ